MYGALVGKVSSIENKISSIISLATIGVLNNKAREIENKITDTSGLIRKIEYDVKLKEIV